MLAGKILSAKSIGDFNKLLSQSHYGNMFHIHQKAAYL